MIGENWNRKIIWKTIIDCQEMSLPSKKNCKRPMSFPITMSVLSSRFQSDVQSSLKSGLETTYPKTGHVELRWPSNIRSGEQFDGSTHQSKKLIGTWLTREFHPQPQTAKEPERLANHEMLSFELEKNAVLCWSTNGACDVRQLDDWKYGKYLLHLVFSVQLVQCHPGPWSEEASAPDS